MFTLVKNYLLKKDCVINPLSTSQALMKKGNFGEGDLISYDDFLKSFQKSDAEVRTTAIVFSYRIMK